MDIFEAYDDRPKRKRLKATTLKNHYYAVKDFQAYLADHELDVETVTDEDLTDWGMGNHYSPSTRHSYFFQIASVYKWARSKRLIDTDPFLDAIAPDLPEKAPVTLSNEKLREIRSRCLSPRQELLFHLYAYTGIRMFEGRTLHSDAIQESEYGLQLTVIGKGGKLRYVPVHPRLKPHLEDTKGWVFPSPRKTDAPLSETMLNMELTDIWPDRPSRQAFHCIRRTVASSLIRNRAQKEARMMLLGWGRADIEAQHYMNIATQDLHEAISCLYADDEELRGGSSGSHHA